MTTFESLPSGEVATFSRAQAVRAGYSDHEIESAARTGRWMRVRRGAYAVVSTTGGAPDPERLHVLRAHDVGSRFGSGAALSHQSAVLIHGLPVWGASLADIHVTRVDGGPTRARAGVRSHRGALGCDELTKIGAMRVTTVERSLVDLARGAGFEAAVCSMDAALRGGVVSAGALERATGRVAGRPGAGHARRAVAFADAGSESVGESRLRVALHEVGLPSPTLQQEFRSAGRVIARVDFWWPEQMVIAEFDGLVKYRGTMGQPVEVLIAEKRREDQLRALTGATVIRVTWRELDDRAQLERSLRRALNGSMPRLDRH